MIPATDIERLIAPALTGLGYRLVRVRVSGGHHPVLQIMVEQSEAEGLSCDVTVGECAEVSRTVSAILDVEDSIQRHYTLEVSSPGIDRPLTGKRDYQRFAGFDAKIETHGPLDGRRRFKGRLLGVVDDSVRLAEDENAVEVPLCEIARAKLLLTEPLIEAARKARSPHPAAKERQESEPKR